METFQINNFQRHFQSMFIMFANRRNGATSMLSGQVGGVCVDVEEGNKHSDGPVSDHRQGKGDTDNDMY